jgi:hypothetical protein
MAVTDSVSFSVIVESAAAMTIIVATRLSCALNVLIWLAPLAILIPDAAAPCPANIDPPSRQQ